jgi:hypothetical protein
MLYAGVVDWWSVRPLGICRTLGPLFFRHGLSRLRSRSVADGFAAGRCVAEVRFEVCLPIAHGCPEFVELRPGTEPAPAPHGCDGDSVELGRAMFIEKAF